jgi:subfamily B ATP-binding cassette protein MsbA
MKRLNRKQYLASPITETLGALAVAIVLWFGGNLVLELESGLNGEFFIGYLVIFSQLLVPARSVSEAFMRMQKGFAASERINEILEVPPLIREHPDAIEKTDFKSSLVFNHVSFSYGEKNVLQDIQLEIKKGETVALVGPSGSGKSTLAELIPRFHDVSAGEILIDGIPITKLKLYSLRQLTGLVTQETILFNDTVFNNIAFGNPNASFKQVEEAARSANALEFIEKLPEKFETNIGERGNRLSGGQKQRLGIARALLKNPPILILDEATSALDTESEKLVQQAIENLMQNRTAIVIAHRLSTIQRADKIIVIEDGQITESGTHDHLLAFTGTYKRLYEMQLFD